MVQGAAPQPTKRGFDEALMWVNRNAFGRFCIKARKDGKRLATGPDGEVKLPPPHYQEPESDWPDASWYDYAVRLADGKTSGLAVRSHLSNPPTTWHLIPAIGLINPCIVSGGPVQLKKSEPFNLRYRLVAHDGPAPTGLLNQLAAQWRQ
jgi:hypothetical protein